MDYKTVLELVEVNKLEQFQLELLEHHIRQSLEPEESKKVQLELHMMAWSPLGAVRSLVWEVHN